MVLQLLSSLMLDLTVTCAASIWLSVNVFVNPFLHSGKEMLRKVSIVQ